MEIGKSREEALHGNQRTGWRIARKVVFRILIYADLDPNKDLQNLLSYVSLFKSIFCNITYKA